MDIPPERGTGSHPIPASFIAPICDKKNINAGSKNENGGLMSRRIET
jgi:hypothetical protein